jgi:hypothetical protein
MPLSTCEDELLDHNTFDPNPDYWAALLWRKTMGTTILGAETPHLFFGVIFPSRFGVFPVSVPSLSLQLDRFSCKIP